MQRTTPQSHITDEQLVADAKRLAKKFAKGMPFDEWDDIEQEVAIALLRARGRFDPNRASWHTYSFAIAWGAVKDYQRQNSIEGIKSTRAGDKFYLVEYKHDTPYEEDHSELMLDDMIRPLKPRERFVALCLMAGFTATEIAQMLSVSNSIISRIVLHLQSANWKSWASALME